MERFQAPHVGSGFATEPPSMIDYKWNGEMLRGCIESPGELRRIVAHADTKGRDFILVRHLFDDCFGG